MIINFLGDSITFGHEIANEEDKFVNIIARELHAKVNNYSISGTRFTPSREQTNTEMDLTFCQRVDTMDKSADLVFVFGGTNDFGRLAPEVGEPESDDPTTFYGATNYLMTHLLANYKKDQIIFIIPLYREGENLTYGSGPQYLVLEEYRKMIAERAKHYGIAILDIKDKFGKAENNPLFMDGLHPNEEGNKLIAKLLISYIKQKYN